MITMKKVFEWAFLLCEIGQTVNQIIMMECNGVGEASHRFEGFFLIFFFYRVEAWHEWWKSRRWGVCWSSGFMSIIRWVHSFTGVSVMGLNHLQRAHLQHLASPLPSPILPDILLSPAVILFLNPRPLTYSLNSSEEGLLACRWVCPWILKSFKNLVGDLPRWLTTKPLLPTSTGHFIHVVLCQLPAWHT